MKEMKKKHLAHPWARSQAGFTLVELIVVIAVLGILSGVGVVGYSGYVEKANQAKDLQIIGDVKYALELAAVADPASVDPNGVVVLSKNAPTTLNDSKGWAKKAVEATYGAGSMDNNNAASNQLKLTSKKYGESKGIAVTQEALAHFASTSLDPMLQSVFDGTYQPSFKNDVDELFNTIRDTAVMVNNGVKGDSGAALVQGAAGVTMNANIGTFAQNWGSQKWDNKIFMGNNPYNPGEINGDVMSQAVANAGVLKARNTALACYLRDAGYGEVYDIFANFTYDDSIIPADAAGLLLEDAESNSEEEALAGKLGGALQEAVLSAGYAPNSEHAGNLPTVIQKYFEVPSGGKSQAEMDGMAYYAMMNTIQNVNKDNHDDAAYWDEMAGAVSAYGSIARGETTLDELKEAYTGLGNTNGVVIQMLPKGGRLSAVASTDSGMSK